MVNKNSKYITISVVILVLVFSLFAKCNNSNNDRNTISFDTSIKEVEDSIRVLNGLFQDFQELNYYIDNKNILYINTKEIGKINSSYLDTLANSQQNEFSKTDLRIFSLILFFKENGMNSCFRHRDFGKIVYDYKPTKEDEFDDVRYIMLIDDKDDLNSNQFNKSQQVLETKGNLVLIAPKDAKIH